MKGQQATSEPLSPWKNASFACLVCCKELGEGQRATAFYLCAGQDAPRGHAAVCSTSFSRTRQKFLPPLPFTLLSLSLSLSLSLARSLARSLALCVSHAWAQRAAQPRVVRLNPAAGPALGRPSPFSFRQVQGALALAPSSDTHTYTSQGSADGESFWSEQVLEEPRIFVLHKLLTSHEGVFLIGRMIRVMPRASSHDLTNQSRIQDERTCFNAILALLIHFECSV
jgi:hypothetical protein